MFPRVRTRRPDSNGVERPASGRGSFVDRLRSMQLDPLRRNSRSGTPGATTGVGARTSNADSNRAAAEASRMAVATAATAQRRSAAMEQLNQSAAGRPNVAPHRGYCPNKSAGGRDAAGPRTSGAEPTGGMVRNSGVKAPPSPDHHIKDVSPPRTTSMGARQSSKISQDFGLKVAITLMTRKPHRFDWWLRYHRSLGIYHVFVHVEDTPELVDGLLASEEFRDFVTVTSGSDNSIDAYNPHSPDNYYTLMQRQERQVKHSVAQCKQRGIDWLFHVDDDELLYFDEPFSKIVDSLAPGVGCVVLVNIEAVPKSLHSDCVFEDIQVFTQHRMLAYRNGKSAGRTADTNWHGPHRFTGSYHVVPVKRACVLHFESCTYEQWRNKFMKHRDMGEQKKLEIPFPFYRDSISLFQNKPEGGGDEREWKAFYKQRKIDHFGELKESERTRLALTTRVPPMINA